MTLNSAHPSPHRILVIGASFGLLPAAKIAAAGHQVTVVGRADEGAVIAQQGVAIHFSEHHILRPPMGDRGISLATPSQVNPEDFDLAIFAIQEPQAQSRDISDLISRIADRLPVASIMNMPPPPFLKRIPSLPPTLGESAYENRSVWQSIPPERMTLASPDPQAIRPDPARPGHLQVTLASNFKFAPFARPEDQAILARITRDASRLRETWGPVPVHLLTRGSIFTPLAKWPMLVTGNCRCLRMNGGPVSIRDAVNQDLNVSRKIYEAVTVALRATGAPSTSLVPFESYVNATQSLVRPSSLALALEAGATSVERIDILVLNLMQHMNCDPESMKIMAAVSALVERSLVRNRMAAK